MVFNHAGDYPTQWAAITSIAAKIGCTPETLRSWVRQAERDAGRRAGLTTDERARMKQLERENRELRQANEILPPELSPAHTILCYRDGSLISRL
jgi:transposase